MTYFIVKKRADGSQVVVGESYNRRELTYDVKALNKGVVKGTGITYKVFSESKVPMEAF